MTQHDEQHFHGTQVLESSSNVKETGLHKQHRRNRLSAALSLRRSRNNKSGPSSCTPDVIMPSPPSEEFRKKLEASTAAGVTRPVSPTASSSSIAEIAATAAAAAALSSTTRARPVSREEPHPLQEDQSPPRIQEVPSGRLPCRTPLRGFPSEADRKRVVGCLAAILSSSLIQDELLFSSGNDSNTDADGTETQRPQDEEDDEDDVPDAEEDEGDDENDSDDDSEEQLQMPTSTPPAAIALQTPLSVSPKRPSTSTAATIAGSNKKLLALSSSSSLASSSAVSPEVRYKRRRHQVCVELIHNAASLLFLDKSHARALEPILKIRPPRRPRQPMDGEAPPLSPSLPDTATVHEVTCEEDNSSNPPQQDPRYHDQQQQVQLGESSVQQETDVIPPQEKNAVQREQVEEQKEPQKEQQEKLPQLSAQHHSHGRLEMLSPARHAFTPSILSPGSSSSDGEESPVRPLSPLFSDSEEVNDDAHPLPLNSIEQVAESVDQRNDKSAPTSAEGEQPNPEGSHNSTVSPTASVVLPTPAVNPSPFATYLQLIEPFLSQLSEGAGYKCISLLLLHYLLRSSNGYDARVRHAFKKLAVVVLCYERMRRIASKATSNKVEDEEDEDDETWLPFPKKETDGDSAEGDQVDVEKNPSPQAVREQLLMQLDQHEMWATRKFEALECAVARKLLRLSEEGLDQPGNPANPDSASDDVTKGAAPSGPLITRDKIVRGIKIGSAGIMAGTLFAVTGGLAAPGIAAGIAAVTTGTTVAAAGTATAAVISTLSTPVAVTTMFGVGGGGLVGYKVQRRTKGVTEFEFRQHGYDASDDNQTRRSGDAEDNSKSSWGKTKQAGTSSAPQPSSWAPELFTVVCLSGWLTDRNDFDRPWGVRITPRQKNGGLNKSSSQLDSHSSVNTRETSQKQEERQRPSQNASSGQWESLHEFHVHILKAFYAQHNPEKVVRATTILNQWKGEEEKLWMLLRKKYGSDPLTDYAEYKTSRAANSRNFRSRTKNEDGILDALLEELGYAVPEEEPRHTDRRKRAEFSCASYEPSSQQGIQETISKTASQKKRSILGRSKSSRQKTTEDSIIRPTFSRTDTATSIPSEVLHNTDESSSQALVPSDGNKKKKKDKAEEWSYHSFYSGELYTVKWEADLLIELCDSVADLAIDMVGGATTHILKQTALHTLMSAIALPYALVNAANMIDGTWTLAIERADEAGIELAKSLLESEAGHRPVTLAGFSMGARMIYACLKELARHQDIWEAEREERRSKKQKRRWGRNPKRTNGTQNGNGPCKGIGGQADTTNNGSEQGADFHPCSSVDERSSSAEDTSTYSREPASIVEDVILMGCPNHLNLDTFISCRRVVSGRLINCYSRKDLILSLMFQYKRMSGILRPVCGTCRVQVPGVENYDVSHLVSSHSDYCGAVRDIMRLVRYGEPRPNSLPIPLPAADA